MEDTYYWRLAAKHFAGEASEQEIEALRAWIASDPIHHAWFTEAVQAWERGLRRDIPRIDALAAWSKLEDRIEQDEAASKPLSSARRRDRHDDLTNRRYLDRRRLPRAVGRSVPRVIGGVVVVLLVAFVVLLWLAPQSNVISTERGKRITVDLADGTRVHLNAESRLEMSGFSSRGTREVHLEGEAFFEVARDVRRPFLVHTHEGVIRVVGTAFNVEAYADERQVSIAVAEGAVALLVKDTSEVASENAVVLRPHQLGVMVNRRLRALHPDVDLTVHLAWTEGRLVFEDTPFSEVVRRLERWYDLEIEGDSLPSVDQLNAVFEQESADEVIRDIAVALGLHYEHEGNRVRFYRPAP